MHRATEGKKVGQTGTKASMEQKVLETLEEKIVDLVSKLAQVREENTRLKEKVLTLEKELREKNEIIQRLSTQRKAIQMKIDRLIRRIEEYQEVLSKGEEDHGQS
ncbi:MAG: hypothetical protein DRI92_01315 [Aquificota bacterium]|uniref:Cell division protein ZapB n=1 Tax=Thermosulfidibacter takaii TaxID=412593 RepID=A0A7C0Y5X6_9BACT|nr:MAG: hypothetical protein DRI92_01315 [Aquificota bacterium]HDD53155.1 cell division protein ZapB [Thermosulfidibacter takaii]